MGATLNIAEAMNAYTYSDRATWLKFKNKQNHKVLFDNDKNNAKSVWYSVDK